jgi:hypothetical protein
LLLKGEERRCSGRILEVVLFEFAPNGDLKPIFWAHRKESGKRVMFEIIDDYD